MAKTAELIEERALRGRLERLQRVVQINRELSATLEWPELLQSIVRAAAELTDSEQGAVAQYDASEDCLRFITAPWLSAEQMKKAKVPIEGSIMGQAFRSLWPVISEEVQQEPEHYKEVDKLTQFDTRSLLAVPLALQGHATGVLSAVNKRSGPFNKEDVLVMESLAAQAAIAIQNAQLIRQSREAYEALAELDELRNNFIAVTSHELRIPLGLILGHASYLKETLKGEEKRQTEVIEKAALRLKQIVEDISTIQLVDSGHSALRLETYDLAAQLRQLLSTYDALAKERGVAISARLPNEPVMIEADKEKIYAAVDQVARNAVQFTNKNGQVEIGVHENGKAIEIQIADTGIGIPTQELGRIFDRFYQIEDHMTRRHGGMGLGLTVAKMMVELHGGQISVESLPTKGSRFTIRLPSKNSFAK